MFLILRSLLLLIFAQLIGCGVSGDSTPTKSSGNQKVVSTLTVAELEGAPTINASTFTVNVNNTIGNRYVSFTYGLDTQYNLVPGTFGKPLVLSVTSEGDHNLFLKGVLANGTTDMVKGYRFTVRSIGNVGNGKYFGDSLIYYDKQNNMSVRFVDYSGVRINDNISGKITVSGSRELAVAHVGSSVPDVNSSSENVDLLFADASASSPERMRASGVGKYISMEMFFGGEDVYNTSVWGDIRLYRRDLGNFLVATSSEMKGTSNNSTNPLAVVSPIQSILTLYTLDNRYFYGHIRLMDLSSEKVLTYNVKGDAGLTGLSTLNNGVTLTLTNALGYYWPLKLFRWPTNYQYYGAYNYNYNQATGSLTVTVNSQGQYELNQLSVTLPGYAVYDAAPNNLATLKTFTAL